MLFHSLSNIKKTVVTVGASSSATGYSRGALEKQRGKFMKVCTVVCVCVMNNALFMCWVCQALQMGVLQSWEGCECVSFVSVIVYLF